jgi:lysozyme family protein
MIIRQSLIAALSVAVSAAANERSLTYAIVDTGLDRCFSNDREIAYPKAGEAFDGQDAQYQGLAPAYRDNGDGTVSDLNTGLMWQKTPDLKNKSTFVQAATGAKRLALAGYTDWRLPTIKELYSLIDFRGYSAHTVEQSKPYIDTNYFAFVWGRESKGERLIDAQYWSSTEYLGKTMGGNPTVFGVNFADGRIKGYPKVSPRGEMTQFVRYVRGNPKYGVNVFTDTGDGTVTDHATGLIWQKADSGKGMNWEAALAYASGLKLAGHDDWRLPNAKELQSLVDYGRAPDATDHAKQAPALNPVFKMGDPEAWYWTGTTHLENRSCGFAVYVCVGKAMGAMNGQKMNVHGAGAQRSDPKAGNPEDWKKGNGPQGDEVRILNSVRCVRGGGVTRKSSGPTVDGTFTAGRSRPMSGGGGGRDARPGFVAHLDRDGDGKVSRKEFDGPAERFGDFDTDGDGFIAAEEAPKGPPPRNSPRGRR